MTHHFNLIILLFASLLLDANPDLPINLGVKGKLYEIKEENWFDIIKQSAVDLNKTKLKNDLKKARLAAYDVDLHIPQCTTEKVWNISTIQYALDDVYVRGIKVVAKGMSYNELDAFMPGKKIFVFNDDVCEEHNLWSDNMESLLPLTTKANLYQYQNLTHKPFKMPKQLLNKYGITCTPVVLVPDGDKLIAHQYIHESIKDKRCE